MASKQSIIARAKRAENRVSQYLFGRLRDWKENHDCSGLDAEMSGWCGEVKNHAWPAGPQALWSLLEEAREQAEEYGERVFVAIIPPNCKVENMLIGYMVAGELVMVPGAVFKEKVLGL